jgi:hypothetical protein
VSETRETTTRTIVVSRPAINGHHLVVADILAFADELRKAGIPGSEIVVVETSFETLHPIRLRVRWAEDVS